MIVNATTTRGKVVLGGLALGGFILGVIIGHVATSSGTPEEPSAKAASQEAMPVERQKVITLAPQKVTVETSYENYPEDKWMKEQDITQQILNSIDTQRIRENHKYFTLEPHVAASARDEELANHIRDKFQEYGFDVARLVPYNLLLTQPNISNPNSIVLKRNGEEIFRSSFKEKPIHPDDENPNFIHAFNAFTPAGTAVTSAGNGLIYVNYGRVEDFEKLKELQINVTGCLVIARYGKIYRGNKIRHAEQAGAIGVLLFSDPEDVALEGTEPENVYDNKWWLPGSGMQRGSTYLGDGDPLTPGWPSTEHAYRLDRDEADLHKIPAQPIGYDDAKVILDHLAGDDAPEDWQGGFQNFTYKLGPEFKPQSQDVVLELSTHNTMDVMKSYNVIGMIKGSLEPDRYVMMGNHRDAWGFGGSDPSSGTAQMMETARVYGELIKTGWRPRRTLVFNSWGAEEFGLIGSAEWVEEKVNKIQDRTVTYINTDTCASGPALEVKGSPLVADAAVKIAKMIPGIADTSKTLFDEWYQYHLDFNKDNHNASLVPSLGSGSDHASFAFYAGIPAMDIWFRRNKAVHDISIYPAYHTGFDTFYMVSTFIDPEYKIMQGCGRLASLLLKYFSDSNIIPYNITKYPEEMLKNLKSSPHIETWRGIYDKFGELENAIMRFQVAADEFSSKLENKKMNALEQRAINDQLMKLEQSFIIPEGLPGRNTVRHAIFASSQYDSYASNGYPGLTDFMYGYSDLEGEEKEKRNKEIRKHISDLTILTDRASSLLQDNHEL